MYCFTYSVVLLSDFVEKMSLFKYFERKKIPKEESLTAACESLKEIQNKKPYVFGEKGKQEFAKFTSEHGHAAAVRKFKKKFPTLTESTI